MEILKIKKIFGLLCKADCAKYCNINDLSKELGVKKTALMQFILDNPKLFDTGILKSNKGTNKETKYYTIFNVYLKAEDNPKTDEWLKKTIKENEKYIYINEWNNYGCIKGYYVNVDDDKRQSKWRNTKEKIKFLKDKGILCNGKFYSGSFIDYVEVNEENVITLEGIKKLEEMGWSHNKIKPMN